MISKLQCLISFTEPEEFAILSHNTLNFQLPDAYSDKEKKKHSAATGDYLTMLNRGVPRIVSEMVLRTLPRTLPINAMIPFAFVIDGRLPPYVINYFMSIQSPVWKTSGQDKDVGRFYRALDLIESYREDYFLHNPDLPVAHLPPRRLPGDVVQAFYDTCQESIKQMQSGQHPYDPEVVEKARRRLENMRRAVESFQGSSSDPHKEHQRSTIINLQEQLQVLQRQEAERQSQNPKPSDEDGPSQTGSSKS